MSYDRAGMINKSHNMKRTQQVVEDAKASYHCAKPGHHRFCYFSKDARWKKVAQALPVLPLVDHHHLHPLTLLVFKSLHCHIHIFIQLLG